MAFDNQVIVDVSDYRDINKSDCLSLFLNEYV